MEGTHDTFVNGRSVTVVGSRATAKKHLYIHRQSVSTKDNYPLMNMSHYSYAGRQEGIPRKHCLEVLYNLHKSDHEDMKNE